MLAIVSNIASATIIGGRGFIGSHLVRALEQAGVRCWIPQRDDPGLFNRDLGDIYYCAGVNAASTRKTFETQRVHVAQAAEILNDATFDSFLYLSSTRVYLNADHGHEAGSLKVDPANADDLFNVTKLAGEAVCLADARPSVRVARVSNVYGRGARQETFLASIVRDAVCDHRILLRTALDTAKDYISIKDCVRALRAIADRGTERLYNVASGINVSHAEITAALEKRTGAVVEVKEGSVTQYYPRIDVTRLRHLVPVPAQSVLEALDDLVRSLEVSA